MQNDQLDPQEMIVKPSRRLARRVRANASNLHTRFSMASRVRVECIHSLVQHSVRRLESELHERGRQGIYMFCSLLPALHDT